MLPIHAPAATPRGSVNASPPTRPFADTRRKIGPFSIPAVFSRFSGKIDDRRK